jgi:hypothetical protein
MEDANPSGEHMEQKTFAATLKLLRKVKPILIQITGGEPTLHPSFFSWAKIVSKVFPESDIMIQSNGSFYTDQEKYRNMLDLLTTTNIRLQIRTHPKYYPNYHVIHANLKLETLPNTQLFEDGISITLLGRAKKNYTKSERVFPHCANVHLFALQFREANFVTMIRTLQRIGKMCSPMIDVNGKIRIGECSSCTEIGSVFESTKSIIETVGLTQLCDQCGLASAYYGLLERMQRDPMQAERNT